MKEITREMVRGLLPPRDPGGHKGTFGRVYIYGGSEGYTGAPAYAGEAAVRTGSGLVFVGVPEDVYPIVAARCLGAMVHPVPEDYAEQIARIAACDAMLIGPGLGRCWWAEERVLALLRDLECPVVLDADGINAAAAHIDVLTGRRAPTVLTPHEGEFARLTGSALPIRDRLSAAREFSRAHHCILVLKGAGTITAAPDGSACINTSGNPGMVKGGSGDVLAGMITALLGQKHLRGPRDNTAELTGLAVCLHGLAGDACARRLGEYAMLPSDLLDTLPEILRQWSEDAE